MIRVSLFIIQSVCSVCVFLEESGAPLSLRHVHMLAQRGLKFTFHVGFCISETEMGQAKDSLVLFYGFFYQLFIIFLQLYLKNDDNFLEHKLVSVCKWFCLMEE